MNKYYKNDLKNFIDQVGNYRIVNLKDYEIKSHIIKPRIIKYNSRFSYSNKKNKRK